MNEEKLKQILKKIGQADVPEDIIQIAEKTSRSFSDALNILQTQKRQRNKFVIGFRLLATAAVIAIAFVAGRLSKPQTPVKVLAYDSTTSAYATTGKNPESFWQQKILAAMKTRPYTHTQFNQTSLLNAYKQYLKEKHND